MSSAPYTGDGFGFTRIIRFQPLDAQGAPDGDPAVINPENSWTRKAGVKPDLFTAAVLCTQFDNIAPKGKLKTFGRLEFFTTGDPSDQVDDGSGGTQDRDPDFTFEKIRIVEVEQIEIGTPKNDDPAAPTALPRVVMYRIHLADRREQFVAPRGGRVGHGEINGADAATGFFIDPATVVPFSKLIARCLRPMKLPNVGVPTEVDQVDPPRNLKWMGNSAPEELEKLLVQCGAEMILKLDGSIEIVMIGTGTAPPANFADVQLPAIDRRGKYCIVSSYPHAIADTCTVPCADYGIDWNWVYQDGDGNWHDVGDGADDIGEDDVRFRFTDVELKDRWNVDTTLFRCIQITFAGGDGQPTRDSVVLKNVFDIPDQGVQPFVYPPSVEATIAVQSGDSWTNVKTTLNVVHIDRTKDGRQILWLPSRIGQIKSGGSDPVTDFAEVPHDEIEIDLSFNFYRAPVPTAEATPEYYNAGFQQLPGGITQLDPEVVEALLGIGDPKSDKSDDESQDLVVVSRPQLWGFRPTNADDNAGWPCGSRAFNYTDLDARAKLIATQLIAQSGAESKTVLDRGLSGPDRVELSGVVNEYEWDFDNYQTRIEEHNWWKPRRDVLRLEKLKSGAFPGQDQMGAAMASNGSIGATERFSSVSGASSGGQGGGETLPEPTALFQVYQPIAQNGAKFAKGWDLLRLA